MKHKNSRLMQGSLTGILHGPTLCYVSLFNGVCKTSVLIKRDILFIDTAYITLLSEQIPLPVSLLKVSNRFTLTYSSWDHE